MSAATGEADDLVERDLPQRRCLVSGLASDRRSLVRFVVAPDGSVVPDVSERLPGRGLWVSADRAAVDTARKRKLFARAARAAVRVPDDLAPQVEGLLALRCRALLGLAVRAGQAVFGYEKVREWLRAGKGGLLLEAADGSAGECRKLRALAPAVPVVALLSADELGAAVGRERIVHAVLGAGRLADQLMHEASRLAGFRSAMTGLNGPGLVPPAEAQST